MSFEPLKLLNFDFNADPDPELDPAFPFNADPGPASQIIKLFLHSTNIFRSVTLGFHILCSTFHFFVASLPAVVMKEPIVWLLYEPYLMLLVSPFLVAKGSVLSLFNCRLIGTICYAVE